MTRPSWDETWLDMARVMARRSTDPRLKVGSVLVTRDNLTVLGVGYNGGAAGLSNEPDSLEKSLSGFIHSEVNALIKAPFDGRDRVIYITDSPCLMCAKALVNGRVSEVIYEREYRDTSGIELLRTAGVTVRRIAPAAEEIAEMFAREMSGVDGVDGLFIDATRPSILLYVVLLEHGGEAGKRAYEVEERLVARWPGVAIDVCVSATQGKVPPEAVASGRRIEMSK